MWRAAKDGRWNYELAELALRTTDKNDHISLREFVEQSGSSDQLMHVIAITYRDGLRASIVRVGNSPIRWGFAAKLVGQSKPVSTKFYVGPWENRNLFKALSHAIQEHFRQGKAPYPPERTHLTTGILAAAMNSRFEKGKQLETPELSISYHPTNFDAMREMGASWKIITEDMPQPEGINPGGPRPKDRRKKN
ncbi:MAG: hypothetical protein FJ267_07840 [Planctomycetes bacterium]|nr:hypothetical protein [Planctomycetota bacterium]